MTNILLQIDYDQLGSVEKYILGTLILVLIAAVVWVSKVYLDERKRNHELALKAIEALGANNEIVRNNTDVLNQVKAKL
jgi:hypothetical protein